METLKYADVAAAEVEGSTQDRAGGVQQSTGPSISLKNGVDEPLPHPSTKTALLTSSIPMVNQPQTTTSTSFMIQKRNPCFSAAVVSSLSTFGSAVSYLFYESQKNGLHRTCICQRLLSDWYVF